MKSILESGSGGVVIEIECHLSNGLPNIIIVGFANRALDEAKERIRASFSASNISLPKKRITLNLAPADIPKDSTSFDLALALAIMSASKQIDFANFENYIILGELGLKGDVRAIRGIIGKVSASRKLGFKRFIIPKANLEQAMLIPDIEILPVDNLKELYRIFSSQARPSLVKTRQGQIPKNHQKEISSSDIGQVVGQLQAKRALTIAAAGGHNLMLSGPPGAGKSMLAKCVPSIMPDLTQEEILEITHLHSLASQSFDQIVTNRPFRAPHHSSSNTAIVGGGQNPKPGEISLSHLGVLFFDEFPEFGRATIESLRQPLEDHEITVARAKDSITFPANFILIATANPCPCGYYGSKKSCRCSISDIVRYQKKMSGPIMDRIDLFVGVEEIEHNKLLSSSETGDSASVKHEVSRARQKQLSRFKSVVKLNSSMTNQDIKTRSDISPNAQELLNEASKKLNLSARAYMKTIKVARTIADLEDSNEILTQHIAEALQFRYTQTEL